MRERPILFNADMVRAVLNGRKMQTRRKVLHQPRRSDILPNLVFLRNKLEAKKYPPAGWIYPNAMEQILSLCPFGAVGDRLWVRETFRVHSRATDVATLVYKASEQQSWTQQTHRVPIENCNKPAVIDKWSPSIHMPRWASRITLEITDVRVERLQNISGEDARSEGFAYENSHVLGDIDEFSRVWMSIYGAESWQANPWVWVIEFQHIGGE
jgi:hypothetical protein